jgi:hypothetical protein
MIKKPPTEAVFLWVEIGLHHVFLRFNFVKKAIMDIKEFFNQLDDTARSKAIEQKAKEAKSRIVTETAINFANKLSEFVKPYEVEFEKRNWKCEKRTGNLPYWSLEVKNPNSGKTVKIAIVNSRTHEYEVATYKQDERINNNIYITDTLDRDKATETLYNLFSHLV